MASEYRCSHCGSTAASCEAYIAGDSDRKSCRTGRVYQKPIELETTFNSKTSRVSSSKWLVFSPSLFIVASKRTNFKSS